MKKLVVKSVLALVGLGLSLGFGGMVVSADNSVLDDFSKSEGKLHYTNVHADIWIWADELGIPKDKPLCLDNSSNIRSYYEDKSNAPSFEKGWLRDQWWAEYIEYCSSFRVRNKYSFIMPIFESNAVISNEQHRTHGGASLVDWIKPKRWEYELGFYSGLPDKEAFDFQYHIRKQPLYILCSWSWLTKEINPYEKETRGSFITSLARMYDDGINKYPRQKYTPEFKEKYYKEEDDSYLGFYQVSEELKETLHEIGKPKNRSHWNDTYTYEVWATENDILKGKGNKGLALGDMLTREEAATFIHRFMKEFDVNMPQDPSATKVFKDESNISSWAKEAVNSMKVSGLLKGTPDGKFNPKANLTRAELATILTRLDFYMETGELYDFNKAYDIIINAPNSIHAKGVVFSRLVFKTHKKGEDYSISKGIISTSSIGYSQETVSAPLNDGNGYYNEAGKINKKIYTEKSSQEINCNIKEEELIKEINSNKYDWTWDKVGLPGYIIPILVKDPNIRCKDYDTKKIEWLTYSRLKELVNQGRYLYEVESYY